MIILIPKARNVIFNFELFRLFRVLKSGKFTCFICGKKKYHLKVNNIPNSFVPTIGKEPGRVCCMDCGPTLKKTCPECKVGYTPLDKNGISNFALGKDEKSRICLHCTVEQKNQVPRKVGF